MIYRLTFNATFFVFPVYYGVDNSFRGLAPYIVQVSVIYILNYCLMCGYKFCFEKTEERLFWIFSAFNFQSYVDILSLVTVFWFVPVAAGLI